MKDSNFVTVEKEDRAAIFRVLKEEGGRRLLMPMDAVRLPFWADEKDTKPAVYTGTGNMILDAQALALAHRRFTMIADILPVVADKKAMSQAIREAARRYSVSTPLRCVNIYAAIYRRRTSQRWRGHGKTAVQKNQCFPMNRKISGGR